MGTLPSDARGMTLRRTEEIQAVLREGKRVAGRRMVVYVLPGHEGIRCGFVCGRGVGNAVVRNRALRLMREAWRGLAGKSRRGWDLVFVARPAIRDAAMRDVMTDMAGALSGSEVIDE